MSERIFFSQLTVTSFRKEGNKELSESFIEQINPQILYCRETAVKMALRNFGFQRRDEYF